MHLARPLIVLAALVATALPATANPATATGAGHLAEVMQRYLGKRPGVVTVTPKNGQYDLVLDATPFLGLLAPIEIKATLTPVVLHLRDQGAGLWQVDVDQPLSFEATLPNGYDALIAAQRQRLTGLFDESLLGFRHVSVDMTGLKIDVLPRGSKMFGAEDTDFPMASLHIEGTGKPAADGRLDLEYHQTAKMVSDTQFFSDPLLFGTHVAVTLRYDSAKLDGKISSLGWRPALELAAWLVAHPSGKEIRDHQAAFKRLLLANLPLFEHLDSTEEYHGLTLVTPKGSFGADRLDVSLNMTGLVADGLIHGSLALSGLTMPDGLVPDWARDLVPHTASTDFSVKDVNLANPMVLLIGGLDLTRPAPIDDSLRAPFKASFLKDGKLTFTLGPGAVTGKDYALNWDGTLAIGIDDGAEPILTSRITANGLDEVMKTLAAAPPGSIGKSLMVLGALRGLARIGPDGLATWDLAGGDKLLINGYDLGQMPGLN